MKTKEFKELCAAYTANPNLDTENMLLRTMAFDTKYYVAYKQDKNGSTLRMIKSEEGEVILSAYTTIEDIDENTLKRFKIAEMTFDEIMGWVNENYVDYLVINPNAEALTLTSAQLAKLLREKYYADFSYPLSLSLEDEFKARALRLDDVQTGITSKRLIEIYKESQNEKDEEKRAELLNLFIDEFVNHTKFYTPVLPDGEKDAIGNLIVGKDRVIYIMNDGVNGEYYLFVDASDIEKNIELDPTKTYVSVFDFSDYILMMDTAYGAISGLKIVGELNITIPSTDVYYYNAIREYNILKKDMTVLKGSYAPSEETDEIEVALQEYFTNETAVTKAWLGREIELYKNGKNAFVYNIVLNLSNKDIDKSAMREKVRKILGNRPFKMYSSDEEVTDTQLKFIYETKTKVVEPVKKVAKKVSKEEGQTEAKKVVKKKTTTKKAATPKDTTKKAATTTKKTTTKKVTKK